MKAEKKPDGVSSRSASEVDHVGELSREDRTTRKLQIVADGSHDYACGPMVDHALALAAEGFRVFRAQRNSKKPLRTGWQAEATSDPSEIRRLWAKTPNANVGIFTDDLLVVDVDDKNGKRGSESLELLALLGVDFPRTRTHVSPGGSRHLIFRPPWPVNGSASKVAPGIDIRGKGNLVVAPGSRINGQPYNVLDDHPIADASDSLMELCTHFVPKAANVMALPVNSEAAERRARHYLTNDAPHAIEGQGGDNQTYAVACRVKDFGVSEALCLDLMDEIYNVHPKCDPPWDIADLTRIVSSAYRNGREPPGCAAPETEFEAVPDDSEAAPAAEKRSRFALQPFRLIQGRTHMPALVKGMLPAGGFAVAYGAPNSGKSFVALDLAMSVARGVPWLGLRTERRAVAYLNADGGPNIANRVAAYRLHYGLEGDDMPFGLVSTHVDLCGANTDAEAIAAEACAFARATGLSVGLVVIDTLAQSLGGGDENSGQDVGKFIRRCNAIRSATGAAILVIHHSGKAVDRGARGHSALLGACDTEWAVADRAITTTKQRDLPKGPPIGFDLVSVTLGTDADGDPVTSCIVVPKGADAAKDFAPVVPKVGTIAWALLDVARTLAKLPPPEGEPFGDVRLMKWEAECLKQMSGEKGTRERAFRAGRAKLLESRCIETDAAAGVVRVLA